MCIEHCEIARSCAGEKLVIEPIKKISGEVRLPGSKSLSNRVLLLAALAENKTVVENILVRATLRRILFAQVTGNVYGHVELPRS
jgi:EPSP synthase (3-phosphoshikimate 1-carboxyvinyltransferase)